MIIILYLQECIPTLETSGLSIIPRSFRDEMQELPIILSSLIKKGDEVIVEHSDVTVL